MPCEFGPFLGSQTPQLLSTARQTQNIVSGTKAEMKLTPEDGDLGEKNMENMKHTEMTVPGLGFFLFCWWSRKAIPDMHPAVNKHKNRRLTQIWQPQNLTSATA